MSAAGQYARFGDTVFEPLGAPPPGYPQQVQRDDFSETCYQEDFAQRRQDLIRFCLANPAPRNSKAPLMELVRLAQGQEPYWGVFLGACDYLDQRKDCADFYLHGLLRLLAQFGGHPAIPIALRARVQGSLLGFKYWPDEPGIDSMCTWSENHQILFASAGLIAGRLFHNQIFPNSGLSGAQLAQRALPRLRRWLDLRLRSGFSEWLSHVYYDEDLLALFSLLDFAEEADVREASARLIRSMLHEIAKHSFRGVFGSTHGRSYGPLKQDSRLEGTCELGKLVFGRGAFTAETGMSSLCLVLSRNFQLDEGVARLADEDRPGEYRQQMGIRIADAERWGVGFTDFEDGMVWLSLEAYAHPRTIDLVMYLFDAYGWWQNGFFAPFARHQNLIFLLRRWRLLALVAKIAEKDLCRNTREQVNLYTWKTADGMLSSAQDYRAGYGGDQQSIWQATLGPRAVCFTTHPGRESGPTPNYWSGSGSLPRVGQVRGTLICIYNISTAPGLYLTHRLKFTHVWLEQEAFEEVHEEGGWIFVRYQQGYLALTARNGMEWRAEPNGSGGLCEVISPGTRNIWICQMGSQAENGTFPSFIKAVLGAKLRWGRLSCQFDAPNLGRIEYGWRGSLRVDGKEFSQEGYPRLIADAELQV